jgi:hypothetical protein
VQRHPRLYRHIFVLILDATDQEGVGYFFGVYGLFALKYLSIAEMTTKKPVL